MTLYETSTLTLSAALLLTTAIYSVVNYFMLKEMRIARQLRIEPSIVLRLESVKTGFFDLVVENVSENEAFDVTFTKHPGVMPRSFNEKDPGFLVNGIKYMAPRQSYKALFLYLPLLYQENRNPENAVFEYAYKDRYGHQYRRTVVISINSLLSAQSVALKSPDDFYALIDSGIKFLKDRLKQ